ncbi:unnamed protein product [Allacma fusca]|uniref:Uncharacterized protein n=1 Tax=Allacma fusca TaxID=39272 RepID=A0A8J2KUE2_9HEXA|nr:unnamed protein product [Allacma fusca]
MKSTCILQPLDDIDRDIKKSLQQKAEKLKVYLETYHRDQRRNLTIETFLSENAVSEQDYKQIVRSTIKRPSVFLKRLPDSAFINGYNSNIVRCWQANMDLQFILSPYACAKYIASYLNKPDKVLSRLLKDVMDQFRKENRTLKSKLCGSRLCSICLGDARRQTANEENEIESLYIDHTKVIANNREEFDPKLNNDDKEVVEEILDDSNDDENSEAFPDEEHVYNY